MFAYVNLQSYNKINIHLKVFSTPFFFQMRKLSLKVHWLHSGLCSRWDVKVCQPSTAQAWLQNSPGQPLTAHAG